VFRGTPAARLGTVCHSVLDKAVREGWLETDAWRQLVEEQWDREVAAEHDRGQAADHLGEPGKWPGYQLKRARLFQVANRLRDFLDDLPVGAEVLTEEPLSTDDGLLFGRVDLIIRTAERHQIIDYKSGGVLDRETNLPREAYVRQLQLYAFLEHASSGSWPSSAHLFPLKGAPIEIDIEADRCAALAADALAALRAYNDLVPTSQPASPTPAICQWCSAATVCAPFWDSCDATWASAIQAVAGVVSRVFVTPLGGVTLHLEAVTGSLGVQRVVIKNVDPVIFADASAVSEGDEVAATGLRVDDRGAGYWLSSTGGFTVTQGVGE
jgi:RecB family exonuclease